MEKQVGKDTAKRDDQVRKILRDIEEQKKGYEQKGMSYTVLDEETLRKKLARARSPMIVAQGWSSSVPGGGAISYTVSIHNPDPGGWIWLFGHVFVGPANMAPSVGQALALVDARFPRLTQPAFPGLSLASGETKSLSYALSVPAGMQPSNYEGNVFVYQADWHDVGDYFDRGTFVFGVT